MRRRIRLPSRPGFTLVELMVAMALIIFIMYILAEAFSAGAKTFRDLKAVGDMNTRLRTATTTIRRLLAADHFEGHKRLSDPNFWDDGPPKSGFFRIWQDDDGADEGVDLDSEGPGGIQNHSYRTTTHHLHFTVRNRGNQRGDYFSAQVPAGSPLLDTVRLPQPDSRFQDGNNQYTSSWAEVAIFLRPTGELTNDPNTASGAPLFALHLRQRLLVPGMDELGDPNALPGAQSGHSDYTEVSITRNKPDNLVNSCKAWFNSPQDVTMPIRRFGPRFWTNYPPVSSSDHIPTLAGARPPGVIPPYNTDPSRFFGTERGYLVGTSPNLLPPYPTIGEENSGLAGSDVLLTDVISFDVRVLLSHEAYTGGASEEFVSLFSSHVDKYWMHNGASHSNTDLAKILQAAGKVPRVFDTWSQRKDDQYDYTDWVKPPYKETTIPMYKNDPNSDIRPIRIRAIQVTIRIWDSRTQQSRQVSIVQDM